MTDTDAAPAGEWGDLKRATSTSDDWGTPGWLLDLLFPDGRFFDPCPMRGKDKVDGLVTDWPSDVPVFINPPYSKPYPWVRRAAGHSGAVILLLPVDPSTDWWNDFALLFKVTIITQRLKFRRATTMNNNGGEGAYAASTGTVRAASCVWRKKGDRDPKENPSP